MYVWYVITLHFGLRAREVQVQLKKTDLKIVSESDSEYIILQTDFASKNCPRGTSGRDFSTIGRAEDSQQVSAIQTTTACSSVHVVA